MVASSTNKCFATKPLSIWLLLGLSIGIGIIAFLLLFTHRSSSLQESMEGGRVPTPYRVQEIENLLTPQECEEIMAFAKKKGMSESDVLSYGSATGVEVDTKSRRSKTAWLSDTEHPLVMKLAQKTEALTGLPRNTQEQLQVAYYEPGGKFNDHYDACNEKSKEYCDKINHYAGQRRATLLIYLNDTFEGGETVFPKIGKIIQPKQGKGILFWNTTDTEEIIPESMHRGNPVKNGEKWICTKWSHVREYT